MKMKICNEKAHGNDKRQDNIKENKKHVPLKTQLIDH